MHLTRLLRILGALSILGVIVIVAALGFWPILVAIGGILVLATLHELGHLLVARRCGMQVPEAGFGVGPILASHTTRSGLILRWRLFPIAAYVKVPGMVSWEEVSVPEERTFRAASTPRRIAVALAGVAVNLVLAVVLLSAGSVGQTEQVPGAVVVHPGASGLPAGAVVYAVQTQNGTRDSVASPISLAILVANFHGPHLGVLYSDHGKDEVASVPVVRGGQAGWTIPGLEVAQPTEHLGVITGFTRSLRATFVGAQQISTASAGLVTPHGLSSFAAQVAAPAQSKAAARPVSIVGIVSLTGQALRHSVRDFLAILALVSLALGIFNLIPVPPLDGGYALIAAYEGVRSRLAHSRRYVSRQAFTSATAGLVVFLGALSIGAIYLDVVAPLRLHFGG